MKREKGPMKRKYRRNKGQLAESNADQVTKIRGILAALSLEIATPAEARQLLGLKGLSNVGY